MKINATQIRAARAVLSWSQSELAIASKLSIATIRKIELGLISPRYSTMDAIYDALHTSGIEFIKPDGVRRRPTDINVFEGKVGGCNFFHDLQHTAQRSGGEIFIVTPTTKTFARYCGLDNILALEKMIDANNTVEIKCLVSDEVEIPLSTPRFQFRSLSKNFVEPMPFCSYGSKYAIAVPNGEPFNKLIVVEASKMAITARRHFISLWDKATPAIAAKAHGNAQPMKVYSSTN